MSPVQSRPCPLNTTSFPIMTCGTILAADHFAGAGRMVARLVTRLLARGYGFPGGVLESPPLGLSQERLKVTGTPILGPVVVGLLRAVLRSRQPGASARPNTACGGSARERAYLPLVGSRLAVNGRPSAAPGPRRAGAPGRRTGRQTRPGPAAARGRGPFACPQRPRPTSGPSPLSPRRRG